MSFLSFLAAAGPAISASVATAAPLGAVTKAVAGKPVVPTTNATLSPEILRQLQASAGAGLHHSQVATNAPWLTHTMAGVFVVCAVGLVFLLAIQTTKQEGLSGTIGGRVESAYRPRLGFDQQLQRLTSIVALTMVFFGVALSITGI